MKKRRVIKRNLKTYFLGLNAKDRRVFADRVPTTEAYIYQLYQGYAIASADKAIAIEKASRGQAPRWEMRPDLWEKPRKAA